MRRAWIVVMIGILVIDANRELVAVARSEKAGSSRL